MNATREQRIARSTLEVLTQRKHHLNQQGVNQSDLIKAEYKSLINRLPALILQNGLAHASGFLLAKAGGDDLDNPKQKSNAHAWLLDDFYKILGEVKHPKTALKPKAQSDQLSHQVIRKKDAKESPITAVNMTKRDACVSPTLTHETLTSEQRHEQLLSLPTLEYLHNTRLALKISGWMRRYIQGDLLN